MSKLSYEDKINIYQEKKQGVSYSTIKSKYGYGMHNLQYLERLIDKHGYDILRTTKNKTYTIEFKQEAIDRVIINNEPIWTVALDIGLSSDGLLQNWLKKYKENGYNIVERKRGRPTMNKKELKPKKNETIEEENERLKKENLYLKAELEYSKKLRAVVQARKNQQQKKK
jgi:transposase